MSLHSLTITEQTYLKEHGKGTGRRGEYGLVLCTFSICHAEKEKVRQSKKHFAPVGWERGEAH